MFRQRRVVLFFAAGGVVAALLAWNCRLETPVELEVLGNHLRWEVAGSVLEVPYKPGRVNGLRMTARGDISPRSWDGIQIVTGAESWCPIGGGHVLPCFPEVPPGGDWWVDAFLPERELGKCSLDIPSAFVLKTRFQGRFLEDLVLHFDAEQPFSVSFRRGWINNDFFIRDGDGSVLAVSSIDPRPAERIMSLCATLLAALAAAGWLAALSELFSGGVRQRNTPAPRFPSRRVFRLLLVLMALTGTGISLWTARHVLGGLPHTPDEVIYRLQARWLLEGRLEGPFSPCAEAGKIPLCSIRDGCLIGHYPPAWPLLLAPGMAAGLPCAVPVFLHSVFIVLLGLIGRRLGGFRLGLAAAFLGLASPLAALLFSSTLSHAGSATLLALSLLLLLHEKPPGQRPGWRLVGAGFFLAVLFGIRPLTAVAAGIPLLFYSFRSPGRRFDWRGALLPALGAAFPLILIFAANHVLSGCWWRFSYALAGAPMLSPAFIFEGLRNVDTLLASLGPLLDGWLWPLFPSGLALPLGVALLPFLFRESTREDRLFGWMVIALLLSLLPVRANGLHGYGPRYLFAACVPLWLLSARAFQLLARRRAGRIFSVSLWLVLGLTALLVLPARLLLYRNYNDVDGRLHDAIVALPPASLVIVERENWRVWAESSLWLGCRDPDVPVVVLDVLPVEELCTCYSSREVFRWGGEEMRPLGGCDACGEYCPMMN